MAATDRGCEVGLIGLGVMGRSLAYNIADHGYSVAGYDRDGGKAKELMAGAGRGQTVRGSASLKEFVGLLRRPRTVILLVPAGEAVDRVIEQLLPYLAQNGHSWVMPTFLQCQEEMGVCRIAIGLEE